MPHSSTKPALQVGSRVIAKQKTGVCEVGEIGLVYERYQHLSGDQEPGFSIIFESGRYDGFSPGEIRSMITLTGEVEPSLAGSNSPM